MATGGTRHSLLAARSHLAREEDAWHKAPPPFMPTLDTSDVVLETQPFWFRYRKEIAGALAFVLMALLGFAGWRLYQQRRENAAAAAFAEAKTAADYQALTEHYGDAPAAASALLLLADEQRKAGNLPEANATLQRFIDKFPRHELVSTARMSLASNLQAMGKLDEAAAAYQQIASNDPGSFNAPLGLLAQAQILQGKGRDDDARRICETIMSQYQGSYPAMEAGQMLRALKPSAAPEEPATPAVSPVLTPSASAKP